MRRKLLVIAGLSLLPITVAVLWCVQPGDPISAANFDRIEVGMTQRQVIKILGGSSSRASFYGSGSIHSWVGRGGRKIIVDFRLEDEFYKKENGDCIVESKEFVNPNVWDRILSWWAGQRFSRNDPVGGKAKVVGTA